MNIKKAIIPAAGLGTRFLPATKAQPKEMLPIVDKPAIQYIVEEAAASGIEDILIISGRGKRAIEDHFDKSYELEESLIKKEKFAILEEVQAISKLANIHYIRQNEPKGLGHAVWCARKFIGNEPFAVMLGDDIVKSDVPCMKQLIAYFNKALTPIVGVQAVPHEEVSKYGIVDPGGREIEGAVIPVQTLVEKPDAASAPSNYAIMGRYILTPDIFTILEHQKPGAGGEIQLTDAIVTLNKVQPVHAYHFEGKRYDIGDKVGFMKAMIEFALERTDIRGQLLPILKAAYEQESVRK